MSRQLKTRAGVIQFPAFIPVTTFGDKFPLDNLIRPYLPRFAQAAMVSRHYAQAMTDDNRPRLPVFVDSGGFAALFNNSSVEEIDGLGIICIETEEGTEIIDPMGVLDFQEQVADVAFTLDFPIPPNTEETEATRRLDLTIRNALWALENKRRRDLPLYGCIQAWDVTSARDCARAYAGKGFDGIAIGGLVPRARNKKLVFSILEAVRKEIPELPIHAFGLGKPEMLKELFALDIDSSDSSSYVRLASDGKIWDSGDALSEPSPSERMQLALCNLAGACGHSLPFQFGTGLTATRNH